MSITIDDRVFATSTSTGLGDFTLGAAESAHQAWSVVGDGATVPYVIAHQTQDEFETGLGTYTASGTTLSRDTVYESSNAGSLVNFSAGTKDVFLDIPSSLLVYVDSSVPGIKPGSLSITNELAKFDANGVIVGAGVAAPAPTDAQYVTLAVNATLSDERVLTGTANQITVTDGGAGSTVTLSTPQNLDTGADVTFATITVTGTTTLNTVAYTWPAADGSANAVLTTDGAGTLSWGTAHPESTTTNSTTTTDATQTEIDATSTLSDDTAFFAKVTVLARCTADSGGTASVGDVWSVFLVGTLRRVSGTLTLRNESVIPGASDQALASRIKLVADDTNKVLQVQVQGFANNSILWYVVCELLEVST